MDTKKTQYKLIETTVPVPLLPTQKLNGGLYDDNEAGKTFTWKNANNEAYGGTGGILIAYSHTIRNNITTYFFYSNQISSAVYEYVTKKCKSTIKTELSSMNSKTVIRIEEVELARSHKYCEAI